MIKDSNYFLALSLGYYPWALFYKHVKLTLKLSPTSFKIHCLILPTAIVLKGYFLFPSFFHIY